MEALLIKSTALPTLHKLILPLACPLAVPHPVTVGQASSLHLPPPVSQPLGLQGRLGLPVGLVDQPVLKVQSNMRTQTCIHQLQRRQHADH